MSTVIRPEVSVKNTYHISRHRYYELKHFCLQYPDWKKAYHELDGLPSQSVSVREKTYCGSISDPTERYVEARLYFLERMMMVEKCAKEAAKDLGELLLKSVTEDISYERVSPPCCKEVWYTAYRRFFWLLDRERK